VRKSEGVLSFISVESSTNQACLLAADGLIYGIDLRKNSEKLAAEVYKNISNIVQIDSGYSHFLALKQVKRPGFEEFVSVQAAEFFFNIGFEGLNNCIKFGKITGDMIMNAEDQEKFFNDVMGIDVKADVVKINSEIKKILDPTVVEVGLYGWGSNFDGELATTGIKQTQAPMMIDIPKDFRINPEMTSKPKFGLEVQPTQIQ